MISARLLFLVVFLPVLLFGACEDVPRYTADQVISVAQAHSPDCPKSNPKIIPLPRQTPTQTSEPTKPSWAVEYLGDGKWLVTKECPSGKTRWYFYEDTGELVVK